MKKYFIFILIFICKYGFSQWSDVGLGTDNRINALYVDSVSNLLFVGGDFQNAGGTNSNNIATWDGNSWSEFGNNQQFSSPGFVETIVNFNGSIIVGGEFDSIGSTLVNNVALWDGNNWQPMSNGFNYGVYSLKVYKGELYAGGSFSRSGNDTIYGLAKWNGITWEKVIDITGSVNSLTIYRGNLILAGSFTYPGFITKIMGWDGSNIDTSIQCYFNHPIVSVKNYSDTLIAVGQFTSNPNNNSNNISLYFNNSWHSIGNPISSPGPSGSWVIDALKYHDKMYFCGYFLNPPDLCVYNGSGFDSIADVHGYVGKLIEYNGELYAAGLYDSLNGISMKYIARYNDGNISVSELKKFPALKLEVIPNPTSDGIIALSIDEKYLVKRMSINIYSIDNKLMYTENSNKFINELNIPFNKGIYIVDYKINNVAGPQIKLIIL